MSRTVVVLLILLLLLAGAAFYLASIDTEVAPAPIEQDVTNEALAG